MTLFDRIVQALGLGPKEPRPMTPQTPASPPEPAKPETPPVADTTPETPVETAAETATTEPSQEEALPEAPTETEEPQEAAEVEAPKDPSLKKTWTNHELLIDEGLPEGLPGGYNRDHAVLLVRDPFWIHAYWDLSFKTVTGARNRGGERLLLRVHDVTDLVFDGANSHYSFDIPMPSESQRTWYFNVPADGRTYLFQVGYLRADERFLPLVTSNAGATPRARMSDVMSDRFVSIDYERPLEEASHLLDVAVRPIRKELAASASGFSECPVTDISTQMYQESLRGTPYWSADIPKFGDRTARSLGSQSLSSWAVPSSAEFAPRSDAKAKDFWLVADCELIVYGATEPDAKVTVRGQAIQLRPDGSFTLRFNLPNGIHPIPIHAVNADGDMERGITITVSRDTQADQ